MIACFDFQTRLPTYDYFPWLWHVKLLGATEIVFSFPGKLFMRKKWPTEETVKRFKHYILPGTALAYLPCRVGVDGDRQIGSHLNKDIWRTIQAVAWVPRLQVDPSIEPLADATYTVTLRRSEWKHERNSDAEVWREFARRIGAYVFEEHDDKPVDFLRRIATYAQAKMNFGVPNGPLSILACTPYPMCQICDPVQLDAFKYQGMGPGDQIPWALPRQRLIWGPQTMDVLMEAFEWQA